MMGIIKIKDPSTFKASEKIRHRAYIETPMGRLAKILKLIKKRSVICTITSTDLYRLYLAQNKKCALTGIKLRIKGHLSASVHPYCVSIDRVKPHKGYVRGNVRLVIYQVNIARHSGSDAQLRKICRLVLKHHGVKNGAS